MQQKGECKETSCTHAGAQGHHKSVHSCRNLLVKHRLPGYLHSLTQKGESMGREQEAQRGCLTYTNQVQSIPGKEKEATSEYY